MDQYGTFTGKSVGQTFGTKENEDYDASYVDIPDDIRPAAPKAKQLWNKVYAGLVQDPTNGNRMQIQCSEKNDGAVKVDKTTKVEVGTGKKPPMCHIVAFNHIRWAANWLYVNKNHAWVGGQYQGPDPKNYPADTWKKLVWHKSNLQPGHSKCNSQTATLAKGVPKNQQAEKAAVTYVVLRLKRLEPNWF
jgi:hypothetical protein